MAASSTFSIAWFHVQRSDWTQVGRVIEPFNGRRQNRCVDIFKRPDGTFGFEEFRRDPEDMGSWTPVAYYSVREYATEADAISAARDGSYLGFLWPSTARSDPFSGYLLGGPRSPSGQGCQPAATSGRSLASRPATTGRWRDGNHHPQ